MKKKYVLIIATCLIISLVYFLQHSINKEYVGNLKTIQQHKCISFYDPPVRCFEDSWEFPLSIEEVIKIIMENSFSAKDQEKYYQVVIDKHFTDFMSRDNDLVYYVPLYNRFNKNREACLIISSGIDGKINNYVSETDTIYIDEYKDRFNFYNEVALKEKSYEYDCDDTTGFSLVNYFFGQKDYLIKYYNGIEMHTLNAEKKYTIENFILFIENGKLFGKNTFCYKGIPSKLMVKGSKQIIKFEHNGYSIINTIYDDGNFSWKSGDSIALVGTIKNIDLENKVFEFERCVQVDLDFMPY